MNILDVAAYLDPYFLEIEKVGFDLKNYPLDHLGFSATSSEHYEARKIELLELGELIREHMVSGRRISVFKLKNQLLYKQYAIEAIELVEPIKDEVNPLDGFEHVEFTINVPFEDIVKEYPQIAWNTKSMNRPDFPRLKLVFPDGKELKLNRTPILDEA
jgi:predicted metalloenzyme YecM